eukprot:gene7933-9759_t
MFKQFLDRNFENCFPPTDRKIKYRIEGDFTINVSLDPYIKQQRINTNIPIIHKNLQPYLQAYQDENFLIGKYMDSAIKNIDNHNRTYIPYLRPYRSEEFDLKKNVIKDIFALIIANIKNNGMDYLSFLKTFQPRDKMERAVLKSEKKALINKYFKNNIGNPYPNVEEKELLSAACDLSKSQRNNWFSNKRSREKHIRIKVLKGETPKVKKTRAEKISSVYLKKKQ